MATLLCFLLRLFEATRNNNLAGYRAARFRRVTMTEKLQLFTGSKTLSANRLRISRQALYTVSIVRRAVPNVRITRVSVHRPK